jgi:hypothetical protein
MRDAPATLVGNIYAATVSCTTPGVQGRHAPAVWAESGTEKFRTPDLADTKTGSGAGLGFACWRTGRP